MHPGVLQLALTHDRLLEDVTPRTWKHTSDLLWILGEEASEHETALTDALGGYLPPVWVECLIATRASWNEVPGLEAARLLAGYAQDPETQARLATYRQEGRTDLLEAVAHRVEALLRDEAAMAALVARREFDLAAFDRLLEDLPGDHAERLQDAFGASAWTGCLLEVAPADVLSGYSGSSAAKTVAGWLAGTRTRHRAWALASAVGQHLTRHPDLVGLRSNGTVLVGLAHLWRQLGPEAGKPLLDVLQEIGISLKGEGV